ncbi:MAG TPA: HAMP domain-containing protein, partial [Aggregatilineaceae bacterium]|nr:HAMP domain-containing protein [Aggregatilineaceae bacterium]
MFNTLRNRLLASYVAILLILLLLIGLIMLVFLRTQPVPTDSMISDLTAKLLDVRVIESIEIGIGSPAGGSGGQDNDPMGQGMMRPFDSVTVQAVETFLVDAAETRDVRALLMTNDGRVFFDSADMFARGTTIAEVERAPLVPVTRGQLNGLMRGRFLNPDGSEWLFVAQPVRRFMGNMQPQTPLIVMAEPVPRASLRQVFDTFGDTFFVPLLRAGLIGLLIAISLALVISSSVARPLNRMSRAALRIAGGDYRQRVRVEGPHEVRTLAASFNEMAGQVAVSPFAGTPAPTTDGT